MTSFVSITGGQPACCFRLFTTDFIGPKWQGPITVTYGHCGCPIAEKYTFVTAIKHCHQLVLFSPFFLPPPTTFYWRDICMRHDKCNTCPWYSPHHHDLILLFIILSSARWPPNLSLTITRTRSLEAGWTTLTNHSTCTCIVIIACRFHHPKTLHIPGSVRKDKLGHANYVRKIFSPIFCMRPGFKIIKRSILQHFIFDPVIEGIEAV